MQASLLGKRNGVRSPSREKTVEVPGNDPSLRYSQESSPFVQTACQISDTRGGKERPLFVFTQVSTSAPTGKKNLTREKGMVIIHSNIPSGRYIRTLLQHPDVTASNILGILVTLAVNVLRSGYRQGDIQKVKYAASCAANCRLASAFITEDGRN